MTGQETHPEDVVWTQMSDFYVASGQLNPSTVSAWDEGGRDEYGFYALGTEAAYGSDWQQEAWSGDADPAGFADLSRAWHFDDPATAGGS